jgi:hypothetical protein
MYMYRPSRKRGSVPGLPVQANCSRERRMDLVNFASPICDAESAVGKQYVYGVMQIMINCDVFSVSFTNNNSKLTRPFLLS